MDRSKLNASSSRRSPGAGFLRRYSWQRKLGVAVVVVAFSLLAADWVAANDPRIKECGLPPSTKVVDSFDMAKASDYRTHFPSAPDLPELNGESSPAFVVVFGGNVSPKFLTSSGGTGKAKTYTGALCVLIGHVPNVYPGLDTTGFTP